MISSGSIEKGQMWSDMVSIKAEYPDHFRTVTMSGSSSCQRLPNRQIYINTFSRREITCACFKFEQRSLHQLGRNIFNLWLSDSGPEKFNPVSKSILKSVDFFAYHKPLHLLHIIYLYCALNKKFKDHKLLLLLK